MSMDCFNFGCPFRVNETSSCNYCARCTSVFFSDRIEIERAFNEWADKNGAAKVPNALIAFLEINGLLNTDEIVKRRHYK